MSNEEQDAVETEMLRNQEERNLERGRRLEEEISTEREVLKTLQSQNSNGGN